MAFVLCLLCTLSVARAQIQMPKGDGIQKEHAISTEEQAFYDPDGADAKFNGYALTRVTFTPRPGEVIHLRFKSLTLTGAVLHIFDGSKKLSESYDDLEDETTYTIPGGAKRKLASLANEETFVSQSSDGALTVMLSSSGGSGDWVAYVSSRPREAPKAQDAPSQVLMQPGYSIYNVGESSVAFYDDGGASGKVTQGFEGQVTFRPKNAGKKIRITFNKLELFNTYAPKNDELKVYSGQEADNKHLLAQLLKDATPLVLTSTASDGSVTVSFKSTTGVPGKGFEATVQEYVPQAMAVSKLTLASGKQLSAMAAETNVYALGFDIETQGSLAPISLQSLDLKALGVDQIAEVKLYTTGRRTDGNRVLLGQAQPTTAEYTLRLTTARELSEGHNHFVVEYTLRKNATNGSRLDAELRSLGLSSGAHQVSDGNPSGEIVVNNTYVSKEGHHVVELYGPWQFTHERNNAYSNRYKYGTVDQIVTFKPTTAGATVELIFRDFDLYYGNTSYGAKAKFEIYNGSSATGDKLYELKDAAHKSSLPLGGRVRSTSPDGALTVVFNPKASTSTYTANGWHATAQEYRSRPMQFFTARLFQSELGDVVSGAKAQGILGIELTTQGDQNPVTLNALELDMKESLGAVQRVQLYKTTTEAFDTAHPLAELTPSARVGRITLGEPLVLGEGKNYLWIAYDIKANAKPETVLDAMLSKLVLSSGEQSISAEEPSGQRVVKSIYLWTGQDAELQLGEYPVRFYDAGGATGNYQAVDKSKLHIKPRPGEVVKMRFITFNTLGTDHFIVYQGNTTEESAKLADLAYRKTDLKDILAVLPDGSLTVTFSSRSKTGNVGWEIELSSYQPKALAVEAVRAVAIQPEKAILAGQGSMALLKLAVDVSGDFGTVALPALTLRPMAGDLTALASEVALYDTQLDDSFSTHHPIGITPVRSGAIALLGNHSFRTAGTHYVWLAVKALPELTAGASASVQLAAEGWPASINQELSATVQLTAKRGVSGRYLVGSSAEATYRSLEEAWKALQQSGIEGPVELALEAGEYQGPIELNNEVPGASERNRITITSAARDASTVKLLLNARKTTKNNKVLSLNAAHYVTLEYLTISTTQKDYDAVVLVHRSQHFTLKHCTVSAPKSVNPTGETITLLKVSGVNDQAYQNSDFATVENCTFTGGYKGVEFRGSSYVSRPKQRGGRIIGNAFSEQGSISCYVLAEDGALIQGNSFSASGDVHGPYKAIDVELLGNTSIRNNKIAIAAIHGPKVGYNSANGNVQLIHLRRGRVLTLMQGRNLVVNNTVDILADDKMKDMVAIYINDSDIERLDILHNTVRISPAGEGVTLNAQKVAALHLYGKKNNLPKDIKVSGNLFQIVTNVGSAYSIQYADHLDALSIDHNVLYAPESSYASVSSATHGFADWQTRGKDGHSAVRRAVFVEDGLELLSDEGLRIVPDLEGAEVDITGRRRATDELSTAGAYEYQAISIPQLVEGSLNLSSTTVSTASIKLRTTASGHVYALAQAAQEAEPTIEALKATNPTAINVNEEVTLTLSALKPNTEYKIYFLFKSLDNRFGELISSPLTFKTKHLPTAVATFEAAESDGFEDFEDGTFSFTGFNLVKSVGYKAESKQIAKMEGTGSIVPTNTDDVIHIDGLFIKSDHTVTLNALDLSKEPMVQRTLTVDAQGKGWIYVDLKRLSPLSALNIDAQGDVYVDDVAGAPQAFSLEAIEPNITINQGEVLRRQAQVRGGVYPYSYEWRSAKYGVVGTKSELSYSPQEGQAITLKVTDGWGQERTMTFAVAVRGQITVADFEDLQLAKESHWIGDEQQIRSSFVSGSYRFENSYMPEVATWSGYSYSNQTATTFSRLFPDQFNSAAGGGALGSSTFAVAYPSSSSKLYPLASDGAAEVVSGFYITNSAWVLAASKSGTGMGPEAERNRPFGQGDWFRLRAKGSNGRTVDFYLCDYRSLNPNEHYTLDTWEWFDLSSLGAVEYISFEMDGTRHNNSSTTIPTYFCMDNLGGKPSTQKLQKLTLKLGVKHESDLKQLLRSDLPLSWGDLVTFTLVEGGDTEIISRSISAGKLQLKALAEGAETLLIKASARGQSLYFELPVDLVQSASLSDVDSTSTLSVYPNPAVEHIRLTSSGHVRIYTMSGLLVYEEHNYEAGQAISIGHLASGMYIAELSGVSLRWHKP